MSLLVSGERAGTGHEAMLAAMRFWPQPAGLKWMERTGNATRDMLAGAMGMRGGVACGARTSGTAVVRDLDFRK